MKNLMCISYSYTTTMGDSRDWMYAGFKKVGFTHVSGLPRPRSLWTVHLLCHKCRNMLYHNKSQVTRDIYTNDFVPDYVGSSISIGSHVVKERHNQKWMTVKMLEI